MKQVYLHRGQLLYKLCSARDSVNICSRRWGKSWLVAMRIMENVLEMPGGLGVFVASSFRQAHSRTLPAALMAMEEFGWRRDVHYVIGHRPDPRLGFREPLFCPSDLKDVVWFANGTLMVIISQEVVMSANSMTVHWVVGDEAKGLDYYKLSNELFPAVGGSDRWFNDPAKYPHLWGKHFFTDMPTGKDGLWLVKKYEKEYDKELCDTIIAMECEIRRLELQTANTYNSRKAARLRRQVNLLRSKALYYQERPIFDNIAVVGADYVKRCERDLTPLVFRTSILTRRIDKVEGMFYDSFDRKVHTYHATDNSRLNDYRAQHYDCLLDTDLDRHKPIAVSFDYGALINWLVAAQIQGHVHKTLKSFFTKHKQRLREVIQLFCDYYESHLNKTVIYYFDSTALATGYVEVGHSAYDIVHDEFARHGWVVKDVPLGNPMRHDAKHSIINDGFSGQKELLPMFNADNNEELLQAISLTEIQIGSKGVRKNKSGEKTIETDTNLPLELRTDGTDAWDTNYLGCLTYPYDSDNFSYL
ncbi:MAG: hypothetical protein Q4F69_02470 [Bacteroidia bacterium]|nr:hypothetical protein [Bacteroidia bacterium]